MSKTLSRGSLLIVDDEAKFVNLLCMTLNEQGFQTCGISNPATALDALREKNFDVLLSDLMMPESDGIRLMQQAIEIDPQIVGIIMTGQGTILTAVEAMRNGAFDYILKPFRLQNVLPILDRAMDVHRLRVENVRLRGIIRNLTFESPRYRIVGGSEAIQKVIQMIEKVAPTDTTVLVRGSSGTGKELVARAIHQNSLRCERPLITINCATLQENLLESELFGHERGAFTGADRAKAGLFEVAEGGTLFVDEVAEMAPSLQAKVLRVLEDGHYRRLGCTQERHAKVRIVAATNKSLENEVKVGRFREDLYYRLNVLAITLPVLRDRREDIPALVAHILKTRQLGKIPHTVAPDAMRALCGYHWPGNIRELANVLERGQILASNDVITVADLPENVLQVSEPRSNGQPQSETNGRDDLAGLERRHVLDVLRRQNGSKVSAAKVLGVSRRTLYRLIEKHGLLEHTRTIEDEVNSSETDSAPE